MNTHSQIQEILKTLDNQQRKAFAWRCGMRILPFLGTYGHFNFWKDFTPWLDPEWDISDILDALQLISEGGIHAEKVIETRNLKIDFSVFLANVSRELQKISKELDEITSDDVDDEVMEYFDGSDDYFNSERFYQCENVIGAGVSTVDVIALAINVCASEKADVSKLVLETIKLAKGEQRIDFSTVLLEDLQAIQHNKPPKFSSKSYVTYENKNIWNNFRRALRKERLNRYLQDYERLFKEKFKVKEADLQENILSYLTTKEFDFDD